MACRLRVAPARRWASRRGGTPPRRSGGLLPTAAALISRRRWRRAPSPSRMTTAHILPSARSGGTSPVTSMRRRVRRFGFELTFFRFALAPPAGGAAAPGGSAWRAREIYMAHFAITDIPRATGSTYSQKLARGALGLAGVQDAPLKVWVGDWSLAAPAAIDPARPLEDPGGATGLRASSWTRTTGDSRAQWRVGTDREVYRARGGELLLLAAAPRSDGHALRAQVTGIAVSGLAWFDHEWGSGALSSEPVRLGLVCAAARPMAARSCSTRCAIAAGRPDVHSAGTFLEATGRVRPLGHADVSIEVTGPLGDAQAAALSIRLAHHKRQPLRWTLRCNRCWPTRN